LGSGRVDSGAHQLTGVATMSILGRRTPSGIPRISIIHKLLHAMMMHQRAMGRYCQQWLAHYYTTMIQ
jgi:hypothetical protein